MPVMVYLSCLIAMLPFAHRPPAAARAPLMLQLAADRASRRAGLEHGVTIDVGSTLQATPVPAATQEKPLPTIFIIGDSTVNNRTKGQLGWGDPIADLFDKTRVTVVNRARGGRSSRTFRSEGLWDQVRTQLKPGDFVLVQFGHNDGGSLAKNPSRASLKGMGDETETLTDAATGKSETVHTFGWYMRQYAAETRAKGATAVLLSPVPRNIWTDGHTVARASGDYGKWAGEAARREGALFVDLNEIIAKRYEKLGPDAVKTYFPGDHTHTDAAGARLNAECVVEGLQALEGRPLSRFLAPAAEKR